MANYTFNFNKTLSEIINNTVDVKKQNGVVASYGSDGGFPYICGLVAGVESGATDMYNKVMKHILDINREFPSISLNEALKLITKKK